MNYAKVRQFLRGNMARLL